MACALALCLTACTSEPAREDFVEQFLVANTEASTNEAECVIDQLTAEYGIDGLERELEAIPTASGFERIQFIAMFECGLTDDVEASLATQLEASGIDSKGAKCAASELTAQLDVDDLDLLLDGGITDEFYAKYFTSLEECDAVPS